MTCNSYIPVLTEIGFPKDIANIINEYTNNEYLNYCILSNKIIEILFGECKYLNVELLHKDITTLLIQNLGLTFNDFIEKFRVEVSFYLFKDKTYNAKKFYEMMDKVIDEIIKLILKMVKLEFTSYDKIRIIYPLVRNTLKLNGIKSKHLTQQMDIGDFIKYDFVENLY